MTGTKIDHTTYTQLKYRRGEGYGRLDTGAAGMGVSEHRHARKMAKQLSKSPATKYIEVFVENRIGANSFNMKQFYWTPEKGWH